MFESDTDVSMDDFLGKMLVHRPRHIVGPWKPKEPSFTSMAAERIRAQMPPEWEVTTGVVAVGANDAERLEFIFWASQQSYRPIVFLPHPRGWAYILNQYSQHRVLDNRSWYHLLGGVERGLDTTSFKGAFSWGPPPPHAKKEGGRLWSPAITRSY
jgi:hypothetical protein